MISISCRAGELAQILIYSLGESQSTAMVMLTMRLTASRIPVGVIVTVKVHPAPTPDFSLVSLLGPTQLESEIESSTVLLRSLRGPGRGSEKTLCEGVGWSGVW